MEKKDKTVALKISEAKSYDAGRGIARIDPEIAREMGLQTGDVIGIEGTKRTAALIWPGYPEDTHSGIIRVDGTVRRNAGVSIDDKVQIRKIQTAPAEKILFAPTQPLKIQGGESYLLHNLDGRVISRGDAVELNIMGRRVDLIVISIKPVSDCVIITDGTQIEISDKPAKELPSIPRVSYEDIGGLGDEVRKVREMIELPLRHPEIFERLGVEAPKGVLLHGPPGTGKTLLAKALASETNANFHTLSGPEIMSKFYGESEERLRDIFKAAEENAPSIILIDEIDSIAPKREEVTGEVERRVVAQLLAVMDGLKARGKVVVIGATNRPNAIDPALRRPGRFDREIEIGVPNQKSRHEILQIHTRGMPINHWENASASKILIEEIESFEKKARTRISEDISKIEYLKLEKNNIKNDLERQSQIKYLTSKTDDLEKNIEKISKNIKKLEKDIVSSNKINETIKEKSGIIDSIVADINESTNTKSIREFEDIRKTLSDRIPGIKDKAIREIEETLLNSGVISEDYFKKVLADSVIMMQNHFASLTHGFVGADLAALAREAAMCSIRRVLPEIDLDMNSIPADILNKMTVTSDDFNNALREMSPSALREVFIESPNIHWSDIGGSEDVKQELKEAVEWPMTYPALFKHLSAIPPKGILLYGPPGTGKTMLAKAVATESQANFISVKGPEFLSKWVGESEKAVRETFRKAKQSAPCIVFFDEIDSIAPARGNGGDSHVTERVVSQMLSEIDGLEELHNVTVIAATNRPDIIDPALLRPGRIDRLVFVTPPDEKARYDIFSIHLANKPIDSDVDLNILAKDTEDFTGADIASVCNEATMLAIREYVNSGKPTGEGTITELKLGYHHFRDAMTKVKPYSKKEMEKYKKISENFIYQ
ncbi:MAG: CDC48 family AAA ATPase [Candidatus Methanoperedens sp.]|nr:CDC48 family AAA ATPase [Candidatus Methanoperedens sp.]